MPRASRKVLIGLLAVAATCFLATLALALLAPRWQIPDRVTFALTSLYVVFMLAFLLRLGGSDHAPP